MPLIDTHIHLTSPRYTDLPGLVARGQQAGIAGVVAAAVDEASSQQILAMIDTFPSFVHGGLGVHPERSISDDETARVIALIRRERARLVAIAEVGLPWYTIRERPDRDELIAAGEPRLRTFLAAGTGVGSGGRAPRPARDCGTRVGAPTSGRR